jgi:hypothetical protein
MKIIKVILCKIKVNTMVIFHILTATEETWHISSRLTIKVFYMCSGPSRAEKATLQNGSLQISRLKQCKLFNTETAEFIPCSVELLLLTFNMTETLEWKKFCIILFYFDLLVIENHE